MVEVEFHILSDRKEGLLRELGQVMVGSRFNLISQRLERADEGVRLRLLLRGPEADLLDLEEGLACHPRVQGYESIRHDAAAPVTAMAGEQGEPAVHQVEAVLGSIAKDYPIVFPRLLGLRRALSETARDSTLRYAGHRVGVWVYKRDYALGGKLTFQDALKNIALPAVKSLIGAELHGQHLRIESTPLCRPGEGGFNGHFFSGYLEGLLGEADVAQGLRVREIQCCSDGADHCEFEINTNT